MYKSRRDEIVDMINEEHQQAKKLLDTSCNYLINRIGKCTCSQEEPCRECVDNGLLLEEIAAFCGK